MYGNYSFVMSGKKGRGRRSTNVSLEVEVPVEIIVTYDVGALFAANPLLTEPGVNESTVAVSLRVWNGSHWNEKGNQSVDIDSRTLYSSVILRGDAQIAMFFIYPEMFGVFQFADDHICLTSGTSQSNLLVLRRYGFLGDISLTWKAETIYGFKTYSVVTGTLYFAETQRSNYIGLHIGQLAKDFGRIVVTLATASDGGIIDSERNVVPVTVVSSNLNGVVEFEAWAPSSLVQEDVGVVSFPVKRRCYKPDNTVKPAMIQLQISQLSSNASDVLLPVSKLVMIGDTPVNVELHVVNDDIPELDESFVLDLISVRNAAIGTNTKATLTVAKNDDPHGVVEFVSDKGEARERDGKALLTLRRSRGLFGSIEVVWTAVDGTAVGRGHSGDWDFDIGSSGVLVFAENQSTADIQILLNTDAVSELNEVFEVRLVAARNGARLGDILSQVVTILPANDHRPTFAGSTVSKTVPENKIFQKTSQLLWTASANDPDLGANGRLTYQKTAGNCSYLSINQVSGEVYLLSPVDLSSGNLFCFAEITATDGGFIPLSGKVVLNVHLAFSFRCPPGSYSSTGSVPCQDCPRHRYQPYFGHLECFPCPDGLYTALTGETDVAMCKGKT